MLGMPGEGHVKYVACSYVIQSDKDGRHRDNNVETSMDHWDDSRRLEIGRVRRGRLKLVVNREG